MGGVALGASALLASLVALHPEGLRAPAWVAYAASIAFALAGLVSLARATQRQSLARALVCWLLGVVLLIELWVALAPGPARCVAWVAGLGIPSQLACRSAFGLGALFLGGMLAMAVRDWRRRRSEG
jgi:hypothetical protein